MKTLSQVLGARKAAVVVTVNPRETASHALKLMAEHKVGAVLVMQNHHAVGVVTDQDCQRAANARVEDIMTSVVCAPQQTTVRDALAMMAERHVSHLPVLDDHKDVVGLVSMGVLAQETAAA